MGRMRRNLQTHGGLYLGSALIVPQLFGIGFNLGALTSTMSKVALSDLAFGWQSTLSIGSETVHAIVRMVATPWSWWCGEGVGYPSIDQITGSRMVLKEGIRQLSSDALISWWPFLCFCLLVYGLLPRLFTLFISRHQHHRRLEKYQFESIDDDQLWIRLVGGHMPSKPESNKDGCNGSRENERKGEISGIGAVVLVSEDILTPECMDGIKKALKNYHSYIPTKIEAFHPLAPPPVQNEYQ